MDNYFPVRPGGWSRSVFSRALLPARSPGSSSPGNRMFRGNGSPRKDRSLLEHRTSLVRIHSPGSFRCDRVSFIQTHSCSWLESQSCKDRPHKTPRVGLRNRTFPKRGYVLTGQFNSTPLLLLFHFLPIFIQEPENLYLFVNVSCI